MPTGKVCFLKLVITIEWDYTGSYPGLFDLHFMTVCSSMLLANVIKMHVLGVFGEVSHLLYLVGLLADYMAHKNSGRTLKLLVVTALMLI